MALGILAPVHFSTLNGTAQNGIHSLKKKKKENDYKKHKNSTFP